MKDQVLSILDRYPNTRNNDFYLILIWLKEFGGIPNFPFVPWQTIQRLSGKESTVRRIRQKIQNECGLFLPTDPSIIERRRRREKIFRREIVNA